MKKSIATLTAAAALAGGAAALAAPAQAVIVNGNAVKYVFCSDNRYNNEISYHDNYGSVDKFVTLNESVGGSRFCGSVEVPFKSGSYASAHINNDHSPYVYAAVFSVTYPPALGSSAPQPPTYTLVARDENYSSYGGYNYAFAL